MNLKALASALSIVAASTLLGFTGTAQAATHADALRIPSHINTGTARKVSAATSAASACSWYDIAETSKSNMYLNMDVSLWGMYDYNGNYCGRASDHICATPTNGSYASAGLLITNWWYADGNYQNTVNNTFYPASGQTVCSYSGGFSAGSIGAADGKFIKENTPGYSQLVGQFGVSSPF